MARDTGPHELIFCPFGNHPFMSQWAPFLEHNNYVQCLAFVCMECAFLYLEFWYACLAIKFDKMLVAKILPKYFRGGGKGPRQLSIRGRDTTNQVGAYVFGMLRGGEGGL